MQDPTPQSDEAALSRQALIQQILEIEEERSYLRNIPYGSHPLRGQLVMTGFILGGRTDRRVGYCVQVRKGCGQFGSDMVFLRHADGGLMVHENQSFKSLSVEQLALARPLFDTLLAEEDFEHGYKCYGGVFEKGFLVEDSSSRSSAPSSFTLTETQGDGTQTITAFVG